MKTIKISNTSSIDYIPELVKFFITFKEEYNNEDLDIISNNNIKKIIDIKNNFDDCSIKINNIEVYNVDDIYYYEQNFEVVLKNKIPLINKMLHLLKNVTFTINYLLDDIEEKENEVIELVLKENKEKALLIASLSNLAIIEINNIEFTDFNDTCYCNDITSKEISINKMVEVTYIVKNID